MADIRSYYQDLRSKEAELQRDFPGGEVHVTSMFHRDRGSTPGSTLSASWYNAARVITDGTHRLASREEVKVFHDRQEEERKRNQLQEQRTKQQFFVVVDQSQGQHQQSPGTQPDAQHPHQDQKTAAQQPVK